MPTLEEVYYYPVASPFFVKDVYVGVCNPKARTVMEGPASGGPLKLTLLKLQQVVRQYGSHKNSTAVDVYQCVVMDATFGLLKIVFNSALVLDMPHEHMHPGAGLTIQEGDYRVIHKQDEVDGTKRSILFVNNADWFPGPEISSAEDDVSSVTPEFTSDWIDMDAVDVVMKESYMLNLKSFKHEKGFYYWVRMSCQGVIDGEFVSNSDERKKWKDINKKKRALALESCQCQDDPFLFSHCITLDHPLDEVQEDELFSVVKLKLKGKVASSSFTALTASHKRWCYYWFYAVNFFSFGGGEARELPSCFVEKVRSKYPDPNGEYKGFKSK